MQKLLFAISLSMMLLLGSTGLNNANAAVFTSISMDMPVEKSFPVTQGETITFTGQLIRGNTLAGIPDATVNIVQQVAFGQSKVLESGVTDADGFYAIPWVVDVVEVAGQEGGAFGTENTQGRENRFQVSVVARFDGDDTYAQSVSNSQSFEVRLNALTITVEKKTSYLAFEDVTVKVLVNDANGLPIDPDKITSMFDGNAITLLKESDGVYAFSASTLTPGSHLLQVAVHKRGFTSDDELITFDAMKRKTSVSLSTDKSSYQLGETVTINASLIDKSTNDLVTQREVTGALTSPNIVVRQLSFIGSKATYELHKTDQAGTWTVSVGFAGDRSYFSSAAQLTFTVEKTPVITPPGPTEPAEEKVSLSRLTFVDQTGGRLRDITVGQQVMIQARLSSNIETTEEIAYISQVKDEEGITVALSWITGTLAPEQEFELAVSWIPDVPGEYTAEVFVWKSIKDPEPLSLDVRTSTIIVS